MRLITLTLYVVLLLSGCVVNRHDDGPQPGPDGDARAAAEKSMEVYSALLAEVYEEAAEKVESGEFKSLADYGNYITEENRKANAAAFQDVRDLLDNNLVNEDQAFERDDTRRWIVDFSKDIAEGLKR